MKPSAAALILGLGAALGFGPELTDARQRHVVAAAKGRPGAKARRAKNKKQRQQKKASRK